MFLTNKYTHWYIGIISNALSEKRSKQTTYLESHHIIPRCLKGTNKQENLVLLTAREHFICHALLPKMLKFNSREYIKMIHAFILMKGDNKDQQRYINSKIYEHYKKQYSIIRSNARKGQIMSKEQKLKISNSLKGHTCSIETRNKISIKAKSRTRKPFSPEYKANHSRIMKEKHRWKKSNSPD